MAKPKNTLPRTDKLIIESCKATMDGLAACYGEAFEIVLHDLTDLDHSIIKIVNGFRSGRQEGAPITDFALSMLEQITKNNAGGSPVEHSLSFVTYLSSSKYGKPVKSTTIMIFGKKTIGLLCINCTTRGFSN
jgi:predicted transcriptional regulator YheO